MAYVRRLSLHHPIERTVTINKKQGTKYSFNNEALNDLLFETKNNRIT